MRHISKIRFEALAAYCRRPEHVLASEELRWFEAGSERVLATLIRDHIDGDFGGIILTRDSMERYRYANSTSFYDSRDSAKAAIKESAERELQELLDRTQTSKEKIAPIDFFSLKRPENLLNPSFISLATQEGYSPARGIIEPMMRWYEDADGNFIEQFQTTGFDARIWELYLFALFVEIGYAINRVQAVPDFTCSGLFGEICVEATTVNPTRDAAGQIVPAPLLDTEEQILAYRREYMPIKYAGPLTAKLAKHYWEQPHVAGKPLLFAIQDFHAAGSMVMTRSSLPIYLYGYDHDWHHDQDEKLRIVPRKVAKHQWGTKEIQSGFFGLPGAENVSAVLFNNSATIAKFNRMGVIADFGSKRVKLIRQGTAVDFDPNAAAPVTFRKIVNAAEYTETWVEGADVFHNPRALHPLDPEMIPGAAHHHLLEDGTLRSVSPNWQPLSSITYIAIEDS